MKKCKIHYWIFQNYGIICGICNKKVIWKEKFKKDTKDEK